MPCSADNGYVSAVSDHFCFKRTILEEVAHVNPMFDRPPDTRLVTFITQGELQLVQGFRFTLHGYGLQWLRAQVRAAVIGILLLHMVWHWHYIDGKSPSAEFEVYAVWSSACTLAFRISPLCDV